MKNILLYAPGNDKWIGGLYYAKNIAFVLTSNEFINSNHKIYIYTNKENREFFENVPAGTRMLFTSGDGKQIHRFIKLFTYMVHHIKYVYMGSRDMTPYGLTTIRWIPDFQHIHYPHLFGEDVLKERERKYSVYSGSNVPLILSSKDSLHDLLSSYDVTNTHIKVVPFVSWIEPEIKMLNDSLECEILEKRGIAKHNYAVIMNQFWQHKNHIVVFEAIKEMCSSHPDLDFQFVFTGKMEDYRNPEYIDRLRSLTEDQIVAQHIKVLGFIDRTEQIAIMKNAKFVIQPSLFEGWGTVVEDAKVLDKTILLSDIPVHHEQMNEKCILFDPHDPIALADLIYEESQKEHHDDIEKGIVNMYQRAKEYSKGFEQLLRDLERKK